jgi:sec-independent protein translocase protein TatA
MYRLFDNPLHLVILLVVILIVFGAGKLPGVGAALGQSIKEFKKATVEPEDKAKAESDSCQKCHAIVPAGAQFCPACGAPARPQVTSASAVNSEDATLFCAQCGAKNTPAAKFCAQCGTSMSVHAS